MSALVRCPQCNTFVKPASIETSGCLFCPSSSARGLRNPIPGLVLAATMAAVPACSSSSPTPESEQKNPVQEADTSADKPMDAGPTNSPVLQEPVTIYGGPPDPGPQPGPAPAPPIDVAPDVVPPAPIDAPVYGGAPAPDVLAPKPPKIVTPVKK